MYDAHAIEAINIDQLVTATDRLLLRCKHTVQRPGSRSTIDFSREAALALTASARRATYEQTVFVREAPRRRELLGPGAGSESRRLHLRAAAMIAGAWLGIACACLLT